MNSEFMRTRTLLSNCLAASCCVSLLACGGGGGGGAANTGATTPVPTPAPTLAHLFAPPASGSGSADFKYLKACYFPAQQFGTRGQSGIAFLESLVLDTLPARTAPLYNAQTGQTFALTTRAFKGSNPVAGAPPVLWTGVFKANADGSISGFGAPCTPTTMLTTPEFNCYWLGENSNAQSVAIGSYISEGDVRPQTSSGASILINPGWDSGTAFYFWYEMSFSGNCSAPGSTTIWRGQPKDGR